MYTPTQATWEKQALSVLPDTSIEGLRYQKTTCSDGVSAYTICTKLILCAPQRDGSGLCAHFARQATKRARRRDCASPHRPRFHELKYFRLTMSGARYNRDTKKWPRRRSAIWTIPVSAVYINKKCIHMHSCTITAWSWVSDLQIHVKLYTRFTKLATHLHFQIIPARDMRYKTRLQTSRLTYVKFQMLRQISRTVIFYNTAPK